MFEMFPSRRDNGLQDNRSIEKTSDEINYFNTQPKGNNVDI